MIQMKKLFVLLVGGLFLFSSPVRSETKPDDVAKVLIKDQFVFKVANEVFTISDLKKFYLGMNDLNCMYPESLLYRIFFDEFKKGQIKKYSVSTKITSIQRNYFIQLIKFGKIMVYSKSHDVTVKNSLGNFFYLSASESKCHLRSFTLNKKFKTYFKDILRLEIFMRSRFLPTEQQGKMTNADIKKAVSAGKNLIYSIDKQIDQSVYW